MTTTYSLVRSFVFVALLVGGCRSPSEMIQFADKCAPGGDYLACQRVTYGYTVPSDGDLLDIKVSHRQDFFAPSDLEAWRKLTEDGRAALGAFEHTVFVRCDDVNARPLITQLLDAEMGPHGHGDPFAQFMSGDKRTRDYWSTPEGTWVIDTCGMVSWYSVPTGEPRGGYEHPELYVKPAPESARIWRKLARILTQR